MTYKSMKYTTTTVTNKPLFMVRKAQKDTEMIIIWTVLVIVAVILLIL